MCPGRIRRVVNHGICSLSLWERSGERHQLIWSALASVARQRFGWILALIQSAVVTSFCRRTPDLPSRQRFVNHRAQPIRLPRLTLGFFAVDEEGWRPLYAHRPAADPVLSK